MIVVVKYGVVQHDSKSYGVGQEIELADEQGQRLLATGNVSLVEATTAEESDVAPDVAEGNGEADAPARRPRGRPRVR